MKIKLSVSYLQVTWQMEKVKYINLWRARRAGDCVFAQNLRFLNGVTTPEPASQFVKWRQNRMIQGLLVDEIRANQRLEQQLQQALQRQLQGQNLLNLCLRQMLDMVQKLYQANAREAIYQQQFLKVIQWERDLRQVIFHLGNEIQLGQLNTLNKYALVRSAMAAVQEIIFQLLNNM